MTMDSKIVIDNFLDDFDSLRNHCDSLKFPGETNPVDGVFYPSVDTSIPDGVRIEIIEKLAKLHFYRTGHKTIVSEVDGRRVKGRIE